MQLSGEEEENLGLGRRVSVQEGRGSELRPCQGPPKYRRRDGSKLLHIVFLKITFVKFICLILGTQSECCGLRVQFHTSVSAGLEQSSF